VSDGNRPKILAILSLVLGILGLCGWIVPLCGAPIALAAIVLGILGIGSEGKAMAIIGLVMGGLSLVATVVNMAIGAHMAMSGQNPFLRGPDGRPPGQHAPVAPDAGP